jgi:hypothetical protein
MSEMTESSSPTSSKPMSRVLSFLKEYKELFAAIGFFAGSILWVFGYFATKEELGTLKDNTTKQNKTITCLLQRHVQLLEGEQDIKFAKDELIVALSDLKKQSPTHGQPSEGDIRTISRLEQQRDDIKNRLAEAEKSVSEAKGAIMFRECEK